MRVIVCGSRAWTDQPRLEHVLNTLHEKFTFTCVIEGEAEGADKMAAGWALSKGIPVDKYPADWKALPQAAGMVRNTKMLMNGKPDLTIGFSKDDTDDNETNHMLGISRRSGIEVLVFN